MPSWTGPGRKPDDVACHIRLTDEAEADLQGIYDFISTNASPRTARDYINRILGFLAGFDVFPGRGTTHNNIRDGLRIIGFERRVSIAFVVEADEVVILRLLYAGRQPG